MNAMIHPSWHKVLHNEFDKPYFRSLIDFVEGEYAENPETIFPAKDQIFNAFHACPFDQVKVVILGQDPYPTKGHSHGLCFSVDKEVRPLPKSLQNIFKELETDLTVKIKTHGDLRSWSEQGVLLLNTLLTVREGQPDSHAGRGWEQFTDAVVRALNADRTEIVYLLWGKKAQQKAEAVDQQNNLIIKTPHPSPLSAHRGFFGSRPFSAANDYLQACGKPIIIW